MHHPPGHHSSRPRAVQVGNAVGTLLDTTQWFAPGGPAGALNGTTTAGDRGGWGPLDSSVDGADTTTDTGTASAPWLPPPAYGLASAASAAPAVLSGVEGTGQDVLTRFRGGDGGALFLFRAAGQGQPAAAVWLRNCTLRGNAALAGGGAASLFGALRVAVENTTVASNRAATCGGGAVAGLGAQLSIADSSFTDNTAGVSADLVAPAAGGDGGGAGAGAGALDATAAASDAAVSQAALLALLASAPPSASDDPTAAASGGALWLGAAVNATVVRTLLRGNSAGATGGAWSLRASSTLTVSDCDVAGNTAGLGGGAGAVQGAAALALSRSRFLANGAFLGGVIAFADDVAAEQAAVSLSSLALENNTASAGSLFALLQGYAKLTEPPCIGGGGEGASADGGGGCSRVLAAPFSYGATVATPPRRAEVVLLGQPRHNILPGQARPGEPLSVSVRLFDGLDQLVTSYPNVLISLQCMSRRQAAPPPGAADSAAAAAHNNKQQDGPTLIAAGGGITSAGAAAAATGAATAELPCEPGTLSGLTDALHRDASVVLDTLFFGFPDSEYTFRVVFRVFGSEPFLIPTQGVPVSVRAIPCGPLEQFDRAKRTCDCVDLAWRNPLSGVCECSDGTAQAAATATAAGGGNSSSAPASGRCVVRQRRLPIGVIVGCTVGGAAALLVIVSYLVARRQAAVAHEKYRVPLFAARRREAEMAAAVKAQSELSAMMGHEIRTPANVLSGAAMLLEGTELSPEQQELVGVMQARLFFWFSLSALLHPRPLRNCRDFWPVLLT